MFKILKASLILLIISFSYSKAQEYRKREVRAAWLTTAYRLDWPQTLVNGQNDIARQQAELVNLLDELKEAKFNTILFQVRHRGTLLYPSTIEPFSKMLATTANNNPLYDPLQFAINECHKRGMECHAWLVTLPADDLSKQQLKRYQNANRSIIQINNKYFLDPANPKTSIYLTSIINEIVDKYDVDGIHLDYLRYPEKISKPFDRNTYRRQKSTLSLEDWRRDNITKILTDIYKAVKNRKPWVKVSTSPIGKHSDTNRYGSKGWNAFHEVYQDVFKWTELGIIDQLYPMIYFQGNNFYPFVLDWNEQKRNCQIIPGLGIYFLVEPNRTWSIDEIKRQLHFLEDNNLDGIAYFRTEFLLKNSKGIMSYLKNNIYRYEALQPILKSYERFVKSPKELKVLIDNSKATISWSSSEKIDEESISYNIYQSNSFPVDITHAENLLKTYFKGNSFVYYPTTANAQYQYYAVTAIDRYGNESEPIQLKSKQDIEIVP